MTVERVSISDAEELLEIYGPYVKETAVTFEYEVPSVEEFRNRISSISEKYPYLKAVENGKITGYAYAASFKGRKAYDWSVEVTVYVKKDCRGRGTGRALYEALEKSLSGMGILNVNACIAYPRNGKEDEYLTLGSPLFHERMNYTRAGLFHDSGFKFGRWYDMIWMEKMLGEHTENPAEVKFGKWEL